MDTMVGGASASLNSTTLSGSTRSGRDLHSARYAFVRFFNATVMAACRTTCVVLRVNALMWFRAPLWCTSCPILRQAQEEAEEVRRQALSKAEHKREQGLAEERERKEKIARIEARNREEERCRKAEEHRIQVLW